MTHRERMSLVRQAERQPLFSWVPELSKYCDHGNNHWCHAARDGTDRWAVVARYGFGANDPDNGWLYFPDERSAVSFYGTYLHLRRAQLNGAGGE